MITQPIQVLHAVIFTSIVSSLFVPSMDSLQEEKTNVHVKINEWSEINTLLHLNQVHVSELHWAYIPVLS